MSNRNVANTILMDELVDSIKSLEEDKPKPDDAKCSTRIPVTKGVTTLLKIKKAEMEHHRSEKNSLKIGNITITGTMSIIIVVIGYVLLKLHNVL